MKLFKILSVVTWAWLFLTSMVMEAVRGQKCYREHTLNVRLIPQYQFCFTKRNKKYTAILYRASTGPEQGFPCEVFLTGKNCFLLQGTLFSLEGWVCREGVQTTSQKSTFEHLKFGSKTWKQHLETTNIFLHIDIQDKMHYFLEGKPPHHGQCVLWDPTKRTDSFVSLTIANFVASRLKWLQWLNVSTTPIRAMGCQQCLSLTVVQLPAYNTFYYIPLTLSYLDICRGRLE